MTAMDETFEINLIDSHTKEDVNNYINELDAQCDDVTSLMIRGTAPQDGQKVITKFLYSILQHLVSNAALFTPLAAIILLGDFIIDVTETKEIVNLVEALKANKESNRHWRHLCFHETTVTTNTILYLVQSNLMEFCPYDSMKGSKIVFIQCKWVDINLKPTYLILSTLSFPRLKGIAHNMVMTSIQDVNQILQQCVDFESQTNIKLKKIEIKNSSILSKEAGQYLLSFVRKINADDYEFNGKVLPMIKLEGCELHYAATTNINNNTNNNHNPKIIKFSCWDDLRVPNNKCQKSALNRYQFHDSTISQEILDYFLGDIPFSKERDCDGFRFSSEIDFTNCEIQTQSRTSYPRINFLFEWIIDKCYIFIPTDSLLDSNDPSLDSFMTLLTEFEPFQQVTTLRILPDDVSDIGVKYIAQNMNKTNLQELSLCSVGMGDEGIQYLATALQAEHSTLLHLDISENADISSSSLASLLQGSSSLRSLTMTDMDLEDDHAIMLAQVLKSNTSLEELDVSGNWDITDIGLKCLLQVLEKSENTTLNDLCYNFSRKNVEDRALRSKIEFYLSLNRLGRGKLLKGGENDISASLFPLILSKADSDESVIYWLVNSFSYLFISSL